MRIASVAVTTLLACSIFPVACTNPPPTENDVRLGEPIQGGTADHTDSNVVAILINTPQGMALCSGSLIAPNLVLTAHHCVADPPASTACASNGFGTLYTASSFRVTTSYDAAATIFNGAGVMPPADGVTWWGVDGVGVPGNNICGQDLSELTLSSNISSVCPLVPSVDTDVKDNETYEAIGFGITTPNGQTAGTRYDVTGMTVQCAEDCADPTMSATGEWLGGSTVSKGTCEGDSGGPALDSLGRVIGSVSRGPANACNETVYESYYGNGTWIKQVAQKAAIAGGYTAAGWVTGGATSNPANAYPCTASVDAGAADAGNDAGSDGGASDSSTADDGSSGDAGLSSDAGDASVSVDAAPSEDASAEDGSASNDAGGSGDDGGVVPDAGSAIDAGAAPQPPDAGGVVGFQDSGAGTDASIQPSPEGGSAGDTDAGGDNGSSGASSGCGCVTAGAAPEGSHQASAAWAAVALMLPLLRRRKRR